MRERGREFAEVLADAQKLGYAEADPSFDIDGIDAAHKLAILAALAFGRPVSFDAVHVEGIRCISALDIAFAHEFGYRIKLLGIARQTDRGDRGARASLHGAGGLRRSRRVDGVFNAVVAEGDFVGRVMLEGRGAGAGPTASAVVADLIDLARGRTTPVWGAASGALSDAPSVPMSAHRRLLLPAADGGGPSGRDRRRDRGAARRGRVARIDAAAWPRPGEAVPVVLVTHETSEAAMRAALDRIAAAGCRAGSTDADPHRAGLIHRGPHEMSSNTAPAPGEVTDRNLALELVRVTEAAALAASQLDGARQEERGGRRRRRGHAPRLRSRRDRRARS